MAKEIQRVYGGTQSGPVPRANWEAGSFYLQLDLEGSNYINYNDGAAAVAAAMEGGMPSVGPGDVSVTDETDGFTIEFQGALADTNLSQMSSGDVTLMQKADTVTTTTTTNGVAGTNEVQQLDFGGATTGTFTIYNGSSSDNFTIGSSILQTVMDTIWGSGNTSVSGETITFQGALAGTDVTEMTVTSNSTDGSPSFSTTTNGVAGVAQVITVTLPDGPTEGVLNVTIDGSTSSDFAYSDASPGAIPSGQWTGGGSPGNWTYTRTSQADNVGHSGAEGITPLRKSLTIEIVTVQQGSGDEESSSSSSASSASSASSLAFSSSSSSEGFSSASSGSSASSDSSASSGSSASSASSQSSLEFSSSSSSEGFSSASSNSSASSPSSESSPSSASSASSGSSASSDSSASSGSSPSSASSDSSASSPSSQSSQSSASSESSLSSDSSASSASSESSLSSPSSGSSASSASSESSASSPSSQSSASSESSPSSASSISSESSASSASSASSQSSESSPSSQSSQSSGSSASSASSESSSSQSQSASSASSESSSSSSIYDADLCPGDAMFTVHGPGTISISISGCVSVTFTPAGPGTCNIVQRGS